MRLGARNLSSIFYPRVNRFPSRIEEAGPSEQTVRPDQPRWLEARVEGEVAPSENLVVEVGGGVRMVVSNRTQAGLAREILGAMGLSQEC